MNEAEINTLIQNFYKIFKETELNIKKHHTSILNFNEFKIIHAIHNESIQMKELSKKLKISMGTLTIYINKLVEEGFIDRASYEIDRRKLFVFLTEKGFEAYNNYQDFHNHMIKHLTQNIDINEINVFINILKKIGFSTQEEFVNLHPEILNSFSIGSKIKIISITGSKIIRDYLYKEEIRQNSEYEITKKDKYSIYLKYNNKEIEIDLKDSIYIYAIEIHL